MGHMKDFDRRIRQGGDDAVRAALEYALTVVARWIPVEERLPPLMTEVLGWHPDDRVRAWFRHSGQPKDAPYWELWSPRIGSATTARLTSQPTGCRFPSRRR